MTFADTLQRLGRPDAVYAAALWYASVGLPVFPVSGKLPLTRHGFKDATVDPDVIRDWWVRWPNATGVAAPTGVLYDVIDVDGPDGVATLQAAGLTPGLEPDLIGLVATLRGHHYLVPPTGRGNGANIIGKGVDYRGDGGYTVLPPSKINGELAYRWVARPTFKEVT